MKKLLPVFLFLFFYLSIPSPIDASVVTMPEDMLKPVTIILLGIGIIAFFGMGRKNAVWPSELPQERCEQPNTLNSFHITALGTSRPGHSLSKYPGFSKAPLLRFNLIPLRPVPVTSRQNARKGSYPPIGKNELFAPYSVRKIKR